MCRIVTKVDGGRGFIAIPLEDEKMLGDVEQAFLKTLRNQSRGERRVGIPGSFFFEEEEVGCLELSYDCTNELHSTILLLAHSQRANTLNEFVAIMAILSAVKRGVDKRFVGKQAYDVMHALWTLGPGGKRPSSKLPEPTEEFLPQLEVRIVDRMPEEGKPAPKPGDKTINIRTTEEIGCRLFGKNMETVRVMNDVLAQFGLAVWIDRKFLDAKPESVSTPDRQLVAV